MTSHQVVQDYRILLRHLSKFPSKNILKNELKNQFQKGKIEQNKEKVVLMRQNAYNYAKNVAAVAELRYLRSLDTGEKLDPQEIVRRTAAKVGFALPIEYKGE